MQAIESCKPTILKVREFVAVRFVLFTVPSFDPSLLTLVVCTKQLSLEPFKDYIKSCCLRCPLMLKRWIDVLGQFDLSTSTVDLIPSIPVRIIPIHMGL